MLLKKTRYYFAILLFAASCNSIITEGYYEDPNSPILIGSIHELSDDNTYSYSYAQSWPIVHSFSDNGRIASYKGVSYNLVETHSDLAKSLYTSADGEYLVVSYSADGYDGDGDRKIFARYHADSLGIDLGDPTGYGWETNSIDNWYWMPEPFLISSEDSDMPYAGAELRAIRATQPDFIFSENGFALDSAVDASRNWIYQRTYLGYNSDNDMRMVYKDTITDEEYLVIYRSEGSYDSPVRTVFRSDDGFSVNPHKPSFWDTYTDGAAQEDLWYFTGFSANDNVITELQGNYSYASTFPWTVTHVFSADGRTVTRNGVSYSFEKNYSSINRTLYKSSTGEYLVVSYSADGYNNDGDLRIFARYHADGSTINIDNPSHSGWDDNDPNDWHSMAESTFVADSALPNNSSSLYEVGEETADYTISSDGRDITYLSGETWSYAKTYVDYSDSSDMRMLYTNNTGELRTVVYRGEGMHNSIIRTTFVHVENNGGINPHKASLWDSELDDTKDLWYFEQFPFNTNAIEELKGNYSHSNVYPYGSPVYFSDDGKIATRSSANYELVKTDATKKVSLYRYDNHQVEYYLVISYDENGYRGHANRTIFLYFRNSMTIDIDDPGHSGWDTVSPAHWYWEAEPFIATPNLPLPFAGLTVYQATNTGSSITNNRMTASADGLTLEHVDGRVYKHFRTYKSYSSSDDMRMIYTLADGSDPRIVVYRAGGMYGDPKQTFFFDQEENQGFSILTPSEWTHLDSNDSSTKDQWFFEE